MLRNPHFYWSFIAFCNKINFSENDLAEFRPPSAHGMKAFHTVGHLFLLFSIQLHMDKSGDADELPISYLL